MLQYVCIYMYVYINTHIHIYIYLFSTLIFSVNLQLLVLIQIRASTRDNKKVEQIFTTFWKVVWQHLLKDLKIHTSSPQNFASITLM